MHDRNYLPALGDQRFAPLFDMTVSLMTCARTWRRALVRQISPEPRDVILDVGCGTGALAVMLKQACEGSTIHGTDQDPEALTRAEARARDAGVIVHFSHGNMQEVATSLSGNPPNKVVSGLLFHLLPLEAKRDLLACAYGALQPGGELHLAEFGAQKSPLMQIAFRHLHTVAADSPAGDNAAGMIPSLIAEAGFAGVSENIVIPTPSGSVSLYSARRP